MFWYCRFITRYASPKMLRCLDVISTVVSSLEPHRLPPRRICPVPNAAGTARRTFCRTLTLIQRLWSDDSVSFAGTHYHVENARIEPKPTSTHRHTTLVGGWGDLSLQRAAEIGDAWVPGPTASLDKLFRHK